MPIGCQSSCAMTSGSTHSLASHTSSSSAGTISKPARRSISRTNENGEYPLYRWGQERQSYGIVEKIPPPDRAVMATTNLAMATYYWNGKEHYIPVHRDKKIITGSLGRVETASRIFNVSLGAVMAGHWRASAKQIGRK